MANFRTALAGVLMAGSVFAKSVPPIAAAEYYYRQDDYTQSLKLWRQVIEAEPDNLLAIVRVAELSLWTEGRSALPEQLGSLLNDPRRHFSRENRVSLKRRFWELQNSFLTDQAQNLYLQGKHRLDRGDGAGALGLLNQAANADRGQFAILRLKADTEKSLGYWNLYYQSLRAAVRSYPYDGDTLAEFAKAHFYFKNYGEAIEILKSWEGPMESDLKALYAMALNEIGNYSASANLLKGLVGKGKQEPPPMVYFALGMALAGTPGSEAEGRRWLLRFVETASEPTGWDPFRTTERLVEVRRLLAQTRS